MAQEKECHVGEIRTRVRLTNAMDEELHRLGQLASDRIRTYEADAVVDTGAVCCVASSARGAATRSDHT